MAQPRAIPAAARGASAAALWVEGLVKQFGTRRALDGVSLEVPAAAAVGLVGANGAGKTTFLKCALDLTAPDSGRVEIFGVDSRQAAARARLAYLPERFVPPHYLLGREFLAMTLALGGTDLDPAAATALACAAPRPLRCGRGLAAGDRDDSRRLRYPEADRELAAVDLDVDIALHAAVLGRRVTARFRRRRDVG